MRVVCTAGHVDHGKSTIVRALTGMEPDRFAEEQRRGLTIDLGFAWTELTDGSGRRQVVAFVDLPGHERFIANMLAGAGAVDLALFVVAADEGWMPQSQEHLDILDLLGISHGLVAISKTDSVDAETVEVAAELVAESLAGTAFAQVPVVSVSARTGAGMDELRRSLLEVLDDAPPPVDRGRPRLWVDRSFSVTGAGTVVTGTLAGGSLRSGDEVVVLPSGLGARVRGLQSLGRPVDVAPPGGRVAVNLSGLTRSQAPRGSAVGFSGHWLAVGAFDAWVRPLQGQELTRRGAWHVHAGSGEWTARVRPLQGRTVTAEGGYVRVELDGPAPLVAGDRFVLREAGRRATVGGGVVLDPDPPARARGSRGRARRAAQLDEIKPVLGDPGALLRLHVAHRGVADRGRAAAATGHDPKDAAGLVPIRWALAHPQAVRRWGTAVAASLGDHHRRHPVDRAAPKSLAEHAAVTSGCPAPLAGAVLDALVADGTIAAEGPGLRLPTHAVRLDAGQEEARDRLLAALQANPFAPPPLDEAARRAGAPAALVRELETAGQIVRVTGGPAFTSRALDDAYAVLWEAFQGEGPLTASRAKELLGTSRKYALPLLEELDRRGRTRRQGDTRVVAPPPG